MKYFTFEEPNGNRTILPVIMKPKLPDARNCAVPARESSGLARAKKRLTNANKVKPLVGKDGDFWRDKIEVGGFFNSSICL